MISTSVHPSGTAIYYLLFLAVELVEVDSVCPPAVFFFNRDWDSLDPDLI
jgi:hypothetical protein